MDWRPRLVLFEALSGITTPRPRVRDVRQGSLQPGWPHGRRSSPNRQAILHSVHSTVLVLTHTLKAMTGTARTVEEINQPEGEGSLPALPTHGLRALSLALHGEGRPAGIVTRPPRLVVRLSRLSVLASEGGPPNGVRWPVRLGPVVVLQLLSLPYGP